MPEGLIGVNEKLAAVQESDKATRKMIEAEREERRKLELQVADMKRDQKEAAKELIKVEQWREKTDERLNKSENKHDIMDQRMTQLEKSILKIEENTTFTRRQMTGIIVGAAATALIGGAAAIIWGVIGGGIV